MIDATNALILGAPNSTMIDNTGELPIFYSFQSNMLHDQFRSYMYERKGSELAINKLKTLYNDVYLLQPIIISKSSEHETRWTALGSLIEMRLVEGWLCYANCCGSTYTLLRISGLLDKNLKYKGERYTLNGNITVGANDIDNTEAEMLFGDLINSNISWCKTGFSTKENKWCRFLV